VLLESGDVFRVADDLEQVLVADEVEPRERGSLTLKVFTWKKRSSFAKRVCNLKRQKKVKKKVSWNCQHGENTVELKITAWSARLSLNLMIAGLNTANLFVGGIQTVCGGR